MVKINSRQSWGAQAPRARTTTPLKFRTHVLIHRTGGPSGPDIAVILRGVQAHHMDDLGWADIGYNYMVSNDGQIWEGRGRNTIGPHSDTGHNASSVGVAWVGGNTEPAQPALLSIAALCDTFDDDAKKVLIREAHVTAGPYLRHWVRSGMPANRMIVVGSGEHVRSEVPPFAGTTRLGSTGDAVREVQERLRTRGWRLETDGTYGPVTRGIVMAFQGEAKAQGYDIGAINGVCGELTWVALWEKPLT